VIHQGWLYLTTEQHQSVHKQWNAVHAWLDARGLSMEESWAVPPHGVDQRPRLILFPVDAREDFDRDTALFEFKMAWL
jgi:hypothetical protein